MLSLLLFESILMETLYASPTFWKIFGGRPLSVVLKIVILTDVDLIPWKWFRLKVVKMIFD